jgi:hypothetical protein
MFVVFRCRLRYIGKVTSIGKIHPMNVATNFNIKLN